MTFCLFTYLDENGEATMLDPERCGYIEGLTDEEIKNITPVEGFRQQVICNVYFGTRKALGRREYSATTRRAFCY